MDLLLGSDFCTRYHASKPALPYSIGSVHVLHAHDPKISESADDDDYVPYSDDARRLRKHQHPVEGCRLNPPATGNPVDQPYSFNVLVTSIVRVKDAASAQLVIVQILSVTESPHAHPHLNVGSQCLAKFYDPLYNHQQDDADPFLWADDDYQCEVAAYKHLADLQGDKIPIFYGSFTATIRTPFDPTMLGEARKLPGTLCHGPCDRSVRCIMIEEIHGTVLRDVPHDISDEVSQTIMKGIVDADSQMWKRDVRHRDLFARNVMVRGLAHGQPEVTIIDFGQSRIGLRALWYSTRERSEHDPPGTYISPLLRWHSMKFGTSQKPDDFQPWIRWDWQSWLETTYKHEIPLITPKIRQAYISDRMLKRAGIKWTLGVESN